jgi:hypothetical protein
MKTFFISAFVCLMTLTSWGQLEDGYEETLAKMFEVSGTEAAYQTTIKQMVGMYKSQKTNVPADAWDSLEKEFLAMSLNDLTKMLVPVYSKHLTKSDLEGLIAFYQSEVGTKFANSTPAIMQESMQVGQQWGMELGKRFNEKMSEKGY